MALVLNTNAAISHLPDNILLEIFYCLTVKDLCYAGRVCRRWRRVASDRTLWKHVNLTAYELNLTKMWKIIRNHFSDVLLSLHLKGHLDQGGSRWKKSSLSDAMLKELRERCPNIHTLELVKVNLTNVSVECLPPRLERLGVISSLFPCGWFRTATDDGVLPFLRQIDLSDSGKTSNSDITGLCHCRHITELKLNGCYRLTDAAAKVISDRLPDLETLEMSGTSCTDVSLHHISRHLTQLTSVNMASCTAVTDIGVGLIGHGLVGLKCLKLDRCPSVTDAGIEQLTSLKQLQFLDVTATKVTQSAADRFKMALPRCNVAL